MAQEGSLFSGLKKLLFKDEADNTPPPAAQPAPVTPPTPPPLPGVPPAAAKPAGSAEVSDSSTRAKAYQMLESINQPGVDFMEVWNAAEESGGIAQVKSVFTALKYADKSLTKEKVLSTGRYYINALQEALAQDLQKKSAQRGQLENEKAAERKSLSDAVADLQGHIEKLRAALAEKQAALAGVDARYEPKLRELETRMASGREAIEELLQEMNTVLRTAERDL